MAIKNIIFDLGGVLLNLNRERCVDAFRALGADEILEHITDFSHKGVFSKIELGLITTVQFCHEIRTIVGKEVPDHKIISAWNSFLVDIPFKRIELLRNLRKRYKLFLLSNTNEMHVECYEHMIYQHGNLEVSQLFDELFYSCRMGIAKPMPDIFASVLQQAGIKAAETVFFDDSQVNIEAARSMGIHGINILPSEEVAEYDFNTIENNPKFVPAELKI